MNHPPVESVAAHRVPRSLLSRWVKSIWYASENVGLRSRERLLPRGCAELVIELGDARCSIVDTDDLIAVDPVSVIGASVRPMIVEKLGPFETIGVTLKPGGSIALLKVSADSLAGLPVPLAQMWGPTAAELRDRALLPRSPGEKLAAVERMLTDQLSDDERVRVDSLTRNAVDRLSAAPHRWRIAELSADLGISRRRLEQRFSTAVGLTPKQLQRLWRFRRALARIDEAPDAGWATFALGHGYYDQPHFNNEFRAHTGTTPQTYLTARGPFINHMPLGA
jgi:AraC-like DNA-binding protein